MPDERVVVHTCCAPCLCALLDHVRSRYQAPLFFFHNPNIHPLIEFRRRLKATQVLAERERLELEADTEYGLWAFLDAIGTDREPPERCHHCYAMRLEATAAAAERHGIPVFTTTLLTSPQQDREALCRLGHEAAERHGVRFDDTDLRHLHDEGLRRAKRLQLYRQQYCGCIFSEYERYRDTTLHLHKPSTVSH